VPFLRVSIFSLFAFLLLVWLEPKSQFVSFCIPFFPCSVYSCNLKTEAADSSNLLKVGACQTTFYHIPEDSNLHSYHCENIKYKVGACQTTFYHIPEDSNLHSYHCENIKYLVSHITTKLRSFKITSDVLLWQDDPGACSGKSPALHAYNMDSWDSILRRGRGCSLLCSIQTGWGAHPTACHWVPGLFPKGWSVLGMKLTTHLHLVPRSRMVELYLYCPLHFHGMALN
jgi:hypothetical protein